MKNQQIMGPISRALDFMAFLIFSSNSLKNCGSLFWLPERYLDFLFGENNFLSFNDEVYSRKWSFRSDLFTWWAFNVFTKFKSEESTTFWTVTNFKSFFHTFPVRSHPKRRKIDKIWIFGMSVWIVETSVKFKFGKRHVTTCCRYFLHESSVSMKIFSRRHKHSPKLIHKNCTKNDKHIK